MMTPDERLVNDVVKELYKRLDDDSIFSLPWVSQVVAIVESSQGYVDNGGFIYFFEGDWPGNPPYSVFADAFRAIGANETATCIDAAAALFPFDQPHLRGDARRNYLREHCMTPSGSSNDSAELVKFGDRVSDLSGTNYSLLAQYIREHLDEIQKS